MILQDRLSGFALCLLALAPLARANDDAPSRPLASAAPLALEHVTDNELDRRARRGSPDKIGVASSFDALSPGLAPLTWPKSSDMRARLLTPELRRTPLVGWIAENLYRSKRDNGWCLEVDPGQGEYVVFYRLHLR